MSSIRVHIATKLPATLELSNRLRSYLWEEEGRELRYFTEVQKKHIFNTLKIMDKTISKNKVK